MTKIKFCGLTRACDIENANELRPEYVGFVFAQKSKRFICTKGAAELKSLINPDIKAVGVFVNEEPEKIAALLSRGIIDIAQLHGNESEEYITRLRTLTGKPIIKAFRIDKAADIMRAENSTADCILLDSGSGGTGEAFDWHLIKNIQRPYFLAGGLSPDNAGKAVALLNPYAVDVSSGIETDGYKDKVKMTAFAAAVRNINNI